MIILNVVEILGIILWNVTNIVMQKSSFIFGCKKTNSK